MAFILIIGDNVLVIDLLYILVPSHHQKLSKLCKIEY